MQEAAFDALVASADNESGWQLDNFQAILYPFYDIVTRTCSLATAFAGTIHKGGADTHMVIAAFRETEEGADFAIWCGDKYLEVGGLDKPTAKSRVEEALTKASVNTTANQTKMLSAHASFAQSGACSFWLNWRRNKELCEHTKAFLSHLKSNVPDFKTKLQTSYNDVVAGTSSLPVGETLGLDELAFKVPVLFEGDRGAGKTVAARSFARTNGYPAVEFGGHESVESIDLLGYQVQAPSGQMVWKDGPLSEAFRRAKSGKVVLIIDELLRIQTRQLSILLTAFSPDHGVYRLRTWRIVDVVDGVAQEETLEAPCQNLFVIATTNVGAEFAVDEIDPALAERFVVVFRETTEADLKRILTELAKAKGFKSTCVTQALKFFKKMSEARNAGLVARCPTTRTMVRGFELAESESDVKRVMKTQALLWVARTSEGTPVPEQVKTVVEFVDAIFK